MPHFFPLSWNERQQQGAHEAESRHSVNWPDSDWYRIPYFFFPQKVLTFLPARSLSLSLSLLLSEALWCAEALSESFSQSR